MKANKFWGIVESFKGSEKNIKKWAKKTSTEILTDFLDSYGRVAESAFESKGMRRLEEKLGFTGDFVDDVIEGSILQGEDFFNDSKKIMFDKESENQGAITYNIIEELERRGIDVDEEGE